jgi:hypothetical protein
MDMDAILTRSRVYPMVAPRGSMTLYHSVWLDRACQKLYIIYEFLYHLLLLDLELSSCGGFLLRLSFLYNLFLIYPSFLPGLLPLLI